MSWHQVQILGHLGRDPEMRYTPTGQAVTNFSVATSRKYTRTDGSVVDETVWWRVTTWGKTAENCREYLKKGSKVLVVGRMNPDPKTGGPRIWEGRDDHLAHAGYEITASEVRFEGNPKGKDEGDGQATFSSDIPGAVETTTEEEDFEPRFS